MDSRPRPGPASLVACGEDRGEVPGPDRPRVSPATCAVEVAVAAPAGGAARVASSLSPMEGADASAPDACAPVEGGESTLGSTGGLPEDVELGEILGQPGNRAADERVAGGGPRRAAEPGRGNERPGSSPATRGPPTSAAVRGGGNRPRAARPRTRWRTAASPPGT